LVFGGYHLADWTETLPGRRNIRIFGAVGVGGRRGLASSDQKQQRKVSHGSLHVHLTKW